MLPDKAPPQPPTKRPSLRLLPDKERDQAIAGVIRCMSLKHVCQAMRINSRWRAMARRALKHRQTLAFGRACPVIVLDRVVFYFVLPSKSLWRFFH